MIGLAIWWLTEFLSAFVLKQTSGILLNFCAKNPPLSRKPLAAIIGTLQEM
jgi:hypothetical protein